MTFLVPFDGSPLGEAALARAATFGNLLEESVIAVVIIPQGNTTYAREHGWIGPNEQFDADAIIAGLTDRVAEIAPRASLTAKFVDTYAPSGTIAIELRRFARESQCSLLFIGSENVGRIVSSIASVGSLVASERTYDVLLVRSRNPLGISTLEG